MQQCDDNRVEDQHLFSLIKENNKEAFAELYKRYHKTLYNLALFYLKDQDISQDIVQDVFLRLWESRTSICIQINLSNYLYTVTKNMVLKLIQEKNKEVQQAYEIEYQQKVLQTNLTEKIHSEQKTSELYKAINHLPGQKKEICLLKLNQELSNQQIADRLGISIQTVKSHYNQSLRFLKSFLRSNNANYFPFLLILYKYLTK